MTNAQIILQTQPNLMKQGIIGSTGRYLTIKKKDGTEEVVPEPEPIHTYAVWKELGYQVSKGQKSIVSIQIWKHTDPGTRKDKKSGEEVEVESKTFLKNANFFKRDQCEPLTKTS